MASEVHCLPCGTIETEIDEVRREVADGMWVLGWDRCEWCGEAVEEWSVGLEDGSASTAAVAAPFGGDGRYDHTGGSDVAYVSYHQSLPGAIEGSPEPRGPGRSSLFKSDTRKCDDDSGNGNSGLGGGDRGGGGGAGRGNPADRWPHVPHHRACTFRPYPCPKCGDVVPFASLAAVYLEDGVDASGVSAFFIIEIGIYHVLVCVGACILEY
jgi:hypothetical protein